MANVNAPFGFRHAGRSQVGGPGASPMGAHKLVGYGTALFIGDAVTKAAAGTKPVPAIDAAITPGTTPVFGVNLVYGAANLATDHNMLPAIGNVFVVQGDGTGAIFLVTASMVKNANIALGAGANKLSKHSLSETSLAVTNTLDLKVRGLWRSPDNVNGQYARVLVTFNNLVEADQKAGL